jgi:thioredoxin-dependent peroxiredoxin
VASVTFKGNPVTLTGNEVQVGQKAPDFTVQKNDMTDYSLSSTTGKTRILVAVPSLDTPVCDMEVRRFNSEASELPDVEIVTVSMDLPFAQRRWCGAADAKHLIVASDHRAASFGEAYGVLIQGGPLDRVLTRAVFVVGPDDTVKHVEYVSEIAEQPDFDAALAAAKA